jgi:uncharacterized membrane protein YfcA
VTFFNQITFPISGVHTYIWLPPLVAFCISFFTSMAGIAGAFLLLPFQLSVLGFTSPAVSATNLVYNIVATPGGIFRFLREKRMVWPLAGIVILGTLPGVFIGGIIRLRWLPDPNHFKVFAGFVLLYVGARLLIAIRHKNIGPDRKANQNSGDNFNVELISFSRSRLKYRFQEQDYHCGFWSLFSLSLAVGILGSVYGIGGGALIAPLLVTFYRLPIYTIAGATLMSTFATSIAGVVFYELAAPYYSNMHITPDWMLGILFGLGGLCGTYLGARVQRYVPATWLKLLLGLIVLFVAAKYLMSIPGL